MEADGEGGVTTPLSASEATQVQQRIAALREQVGAVVLGQRVVVDQVLVALLAGGHVLLEGPPGIGKTLLCRTLARAVGCAFRRAQFTPDLMPSDVTGGNVYNQRSNAFEFVPGPLFTQILLADEINRAPAKTQASLLEAMSDAAVSVDGTTRPLPQPFFVLATQNPIESEGTYPLPEAQLDRFLLKVLVQPPAAEVEVRLMTAYLGGFRPEDLSTTTVRETETAEGLLALQASCRRVQVSHELLVYIADLVARTRNHPDILLGASPRASVALLLCGQVLAAMDGRAYVVPDDIKRLAKPILRHRLLMEMGMEVVDRTADDVVDEILTVAPVPGGARA